MIYPYYNPYFGYVKRTPDESKIIRDNINKMKEYVNNYNSGNVTHRLDVDYESESGFSIFSTYTELGNRKIYATKKELLHEDIKKCDIENILHENEDILFKNLK